MGPVAHAMAAVDAGLADVVVCWRAMNERSEYRFGASQMNTTSGTPGAGTGFIEWSLPFGSATPAAWTSVQAQRYMHRYGVTNEMAWEVGLACGGQIHVYVEKVE